MVDLLLHILTNEAMPAVRQRILKVQLEVKPRPMSHAESVRYKQAQSVSAEQAVDMVRTDLQSGCAVQSFTSESGYRIRVSEDEIHQCSCPDYAKHHIPWKHMQLAARVLSMSVDYSQKKHPVQLGLTQMSAHSVTSEPTNKQNSQKSALKRILEQS